MKLVPIIDGQKYKSLAVLHDVANVNPKGASVDQMRKRVRILDVIKDAGVQDDRPQAEHLLFEDGDWVELKLALNDYPWGVNDAALLAIIDSVLDAKAPPKPAV